MNIKMLSLDGGGTWALLQVLALNDTYQHVYNRPPACREVLNDFHLVAANSGGSLMLAAMIEHADDPLENVLRMFMSGAIRKNVFSAIRPLMVKRSLLK